MCRRWNVTFRPSVMVMCYGPLDPVIVPLDASPDGAEPQPLVLPAASTHPDTTIAPTIMLTVSNFLTVDGSFPHGLPQPEFQIQSYTLAQNSCYTDHPLEGWYRAFVLWPPEVRKDVLHAIIPIETVLSSLFFHFQARLKWTLSSTDPTEGERSRALCQRIIKHAVFNTWGLIEHENAFGCAYTWIQKAIEATSSDETRKLFALHHLISRSCPNSHITTEVIPLPAVYTLRGKDILIARSHETLADTPSAYLTRLQAPVVFERSFCIPSSTSQPPLGGKYVEYCLVGRVLFQPGHFTAQYILGERTFSYDCAANQGRLVNIGDWHVALAPRHDVVMYIYTRISEACRITNHSINLLTESFNWVQMYTQGTIQRALSVSSSSIDETTPVASTPMTASPVPHSKSGKPNTSTPASLLPETVDCAGSCGDVEDEGDMVLLSAKYGLPEDYDQPLHAWLCPSCRGDSLSSDILRDRVNQRKLLQGQYALFGVADSAGMLYYPARMTSVPPRSQSVQLEWHKGNIYSGRTKCPRPKFKQTLRQCAEAVYRQREHSDTLPIGAIMWPERLLEDAADNEEFDVPEISQALKRAFSSIKAIVSGQRPHPILEAFDEFVIHTTKSGHTPENATRFATAYKLDILPGDSSLILQSLTQLQIVLAANPSSLEIPQDALVFGIGVVLFNLVIVRTYLERPPSDDLALYNLLRSSSTSQSPYRLVRQLSHSEQALAACEGAQDTSDPQHTASAVLHLDILHPTSTPPIFDGQVTVIESTNGSAPYLWPQSQDDGLVDDEELPGLQAAPTPSTKPRPKPRPKKRAAATLDNEGVREPLRHPVLAEPVQQLRRSKRKRPEGGGDDEDEMSRSHARQKT
ncbi:hypothetical protein C2E23DRAFT_897161 [Lenzites betulinus]|nr:hypothetical protein C2E23DRAFT_897161 [Lenzites betulinus]